MPPVGRLWPSDDDDGDDDDDDFDNNNDDDDNDDDEPAKHGGPAAESRQPCHELESWLILLHTVREQPQWGQTGLLAG